MANQTEHYKLVKPLPEEFYNVEVQNGNMDAVDAALAGLNAGKVDKENGKGLSENDYTDADKRKLDGIETGAQKNAVTGVKGEKESTYRTGNVTLTAANVGAAASGHSHSAANISSGVLSADRLPVVPVSKGGTGESTADAAFSALSVRGLYAGTLNSLQAPGVYWCNMADCTGGPGGVTGYGYLEVWQATATSWFQRFTLYSSGVSYYRAYTNGQWYDWECRNTLSALSAHGTYTGSLNTLSEPGVYYINLADCTGGPLSSGSGYLEVWRASSLTWFQRFTRWMSVGGPCVAIRFWSNADQAFKDWAWENPPAALNTEYLTAERWNGNPVYTRRLDFGAMPSNSYKKLAHYPGSGRKVVRITGLQSNGRTLPYTDTDPNITNGATLNATLSADANSIVVTTNYESAATAVVQIWYTKD